MTTTISVSKLPVSAFLQTAKDHPFIIPSYQRPYAWEEDQVQTLFDDLKDFSSSIEENNNNPSQYFLGCIVTFLSDGKQEIIDGQQRITSLYLLLRAIYTKLKSDPRSPQKLIWEIEKCLWQTDNSTDDDVNYSNILLSSCIINNTGNEILKNILTTGKSEPQANDNYSKNYRLFQEYLDNFSHDSTANFRSFVKHILENAIVLPISADSQETALTIFSTLNDRGMPLSDADIFKANIYSNIDVTLRTKFIQDWQELSDKAAYVSEKVQNLFYYYMFYLRACDGIFSTTTPGLRKFYSEEKFKKLLTPDLMENLAIITNLWQVVNRHKYIASENWSKDMGICQSLDILNSYPNEFWKYPVIIYYLTHRGKDDFNDSFARFLKKLILELTTKYVITPTINAVKTNILKLNVGIIKSQYPKFEFMGLSDDNINHFEKSIICPHPKILRLVLKILAYQEQDSLLPEKWEIEHIFPLNSKSAYFNKYTKNNIEHIGNKLPFEKRLNIRASNKYFEDKKVEYSESEIIIAKMMSKRNDITVWDDSCILRRDKEIIETLLNIFKTWDAQYMEKYQETKTNN